MFLARRRAKMTRWCYSFGSLKDSGNKPRRWSPLSYQTHSVTWRQPWTPRLCGLSQMLPHQPIYYMHVEFFVLPFLQKYGWEGKLRVHSLMERKSRIPTKMYIWLYTWLDYQNTRAFESLWSDKKLDKFESKINRKVGERDRKAVCRGQEAASASKRATWSIELWWCRRVSGFKVQELVVSLEVYRVHSRQTSLKKWKQHSRITGKSIATYKCHPRVCRQTLCCGASWNPPVFINPSRTVSSVIGVH